MDDTSEFMDYLSKAMLIQRYIDLSGDPPSSQIYIQEMGINHAMPPGLIRHGGKSSPFGCLLMVFHTPTRVLSPDKTQWLGANGHFIAWEADAEHHYGNETTEWNHSWLQIRGQWIEELFRRSQLPLNVPIDLGSGAAIPLRYLQMLCDELRSDVRQDPRMLLGIMHIFWYELERHFMHGTERRQPNARLEQARRAIEENFDKPFNLAEAAAQVHFSPTHFCHRFAKQFGVPPREYALRFRLQRAVQLLANPELAVFQVAESVGYPDALYFSRLFRKRYGVSPNEFRKQKY